MKHLKTALICLCFALSALIVTDAEARGAKKSSKGARTEKTEKERLPRRFDNHPPMMFLCGTLSQDAHSGWKVGDTPLFLSRGCVVTLEGSEEGMLQDGAEAVVMGAMVGGAISARTINVSPPVYTNSTNSFTAAFRKPGNNPNVGELGEHPE